MLRSTAIALATAALGTGAAFGVAACGEDREGDVQFEGGTGTSGPSTSGTAPSTETSPSTETTPSTETEPQTDTSGGATAPE